MLLQGERVGLYSAWTRGQQLENATLNKTEDVRDLISNSKKEMDLGGAQKDKWKVKMDFIWGGKGTGICTSTE